MRIAAYCRVSTDKDAQLDSLQNQIDFFEDFSIKNNYELFKIYADEGISGKHMKNRTEFLNMLNDSNYNLFDMVVVKDISRFARNTVDFLNAIRQLKSKNIEVQFLSNNQTVLGNSEFILTIFSALAQEESANLSKRITFGKKINAQKGRVPNIIYGYDQVDTFTLKINDEEAEIVKEIFDKYANQGYGARRIALDLNEREVLTKKGCIWNPSNVRRMLMNSIYCGILVNNTSETIDFLEGKRAKIDKEKHFNHDRPEYAIISKELFEKAQKAKNIRANFYENKSLSNKKGRFSNKYVFSTLIKCEHCGYSYSRKSYTFKNTRVYWKCTGNDQYTSKFCPNNFTVGEHELLSYIKTYLTELIIDKEKFIDTLLSDAKKVSKDSNDRVDIEELKKRINKIQSLKEKFKNMYANDIITIDELKERMHNFDNESNDLQYKITAYEYNNDQAENTDENIKLTLTEIQNILSLEDITNEELRKVIDHIIVNKDGTIKVYLKLLKDLKVI